MHNIYHNLQRDALIICGCSKSGVKKCLEE